MSAIHYCGNVKLAMTFKDEGANLGISNRIFYGGRFQRTLIGIRVVNQLVPSNLQPSIETTYMQEARKRKEATIRKKLKDLRWLSSSRHEQEDMGEWRNIFPKQDNH